MNDLDPWPLSPILATLPATARLALQFDVAGLLADLEALAGVSWLKPRVVSGEGETPGVDIDWLKLPLRSTGGDPNQSGPGSPGLVDFADTPWLERVPNIAALLARIPAPLRCVRMQSLGLGAESPLHNDTKYGLPWGIVRLHVPLVTTPGAILHMDGADHRWQPGECWYADFTRPHLVRNTDPLTRIHLVIDVLPTPELLALFPAPFRTAAVVANTLFAPAEVPLSAAERDACRCRFSMPETFHLFDEADGQFLTAPRTAPADIEVRDDGLVLSIDGKPTFTLVHVGEGEFRFAGWTTERTVAVRAGSVTLRSRVGDQTRSLTLPADPARA